MAALYVRTNSGSGGSGKTNEKKKAQPGLHVRAQCKHEVYHKGGNCLELSANKAKNYAGWTNVLE